MFATQNAINQYAQVGWTSVIEATLRTLTSPSENQNSNLFHIKQKPGLASIE